MQTAAQRARRLYLSFSAGRMLDVMAADQFISGCGGRHYAQWHWGFEDGTVLARKIVAAGRDSTEILRKQWKAYTC